MPQQPAMPSLGLSLIPVVVLIGLLAADVVAFGEDSSYGANQIAMLLAAFVAGGIGMARGVQWKAISDAIAHSVSQTTEAIIILLMIGALSGTWLIAGIIPAFIHYGLQILEPGIFLFAACIICGLLSLATGSSWGTVGTVGVALVGIGSALGLGEGWIAGAIISGAYFGDKMSPLSDTTNIAATVGGTDLFSHIRYMTLTTVPSLVIALVVFLLVGFGGAAAADGISSAFADEFGAAVFAAFNIHIGLFIAPVVVIVLIARKVPAAAALLIGTLLGALTAVVFQPNVIRDVAGLGGEANGFALAAFKACIQSMALESAISTSNDMANDLLTSSGMAGMLNTVWLILCAMVFGATMQATRMLERITRAILSGVKSTFGLVGRTVGTCLAFNVLASDQYLAIVVPGNMLKDAYAERDLAPENLSRTLEDSGTVTSVLIPWNTCGVAQSGILGVATWAYLPYCIFNWVSPLMTLTVAAVGFRIKRLSKTRR
ncbi:MAG: Na+/H+ antiporter NhaC [Crocinitomicaceae bacterium]|nr:Na+/H+ antiporter NhaC [Crocinitomicaceae bacterium]